MTKNLMKSLTIATAATAALVAQGVAADEVVATEAQTSAIRTENTATNAVTAEQVAEAKQTADTANTAVTAQEAVVADANRAKQTAQEAENQAIQNLAMAQTLAQNATPEAIAAADTAISRAEGTVTTTQAELEQTQSNLTSVTGQAQVAQEQADQAQAESDSAQALVTEKQKKLDQLQAGKTDVTAQEAQVDVELAQNDVQIKKAGVDQAQTEVNKAKEQDAGLEKQLSDAKTVLDNAKSEEVKAESVKAEKEVKAKETEKQVSDAQAQADAVKPVGQYDIKISIPQDVKDTLLELLTYGEKFNMDDYTSYTDYVKAITAEKIRLTNKMEDFLVNKYPNLIDTGITASSQDPYIVKDYTNLTQKDKEQLNQLYLDVLNAFRVELGLPTAQLDKNAIKTSQIKTAMYKEKHFSDPLYLDHDYDIMDEAKRQVFGDKNLYISESVGLDTALNNTDAFTYIKRVASGLLIADLDASYGHMLDNVTSEYIGVDFVEKTSINSSNDIYYNITILNKTTTETENLYEFQPVSFKSDDTAYQSALTKVTIANIANKQAQHELEVAQDKADELLANYLVLQSKADDLREKSDTLNHTVKVLESEVSKAKTAVEDAKARKASLVDAKNNLVKAEDTLSKAKTALKDAETKYNNELTELNKLKEVYKVANDRYIELLNLYNLTQAADTPVNTKPTTPIASGETTPKPSPVSQGDATQPAEPSEVATHQVTATQTGVIVKEDGQVTYSRVAKSQELPETGEASGTLATVFGLVSLGLGLTAVKKRRKYN